MLKAEFRKISKQYKSLPPKSTVKIFIFRDPFTFSQSLTSQDFVYSLTKSRKYSLVLKSTQNKNCQIVPFRPWAGFDRWKQISILGRCSSRVITGRFTLNTVRPCTLERPQKKNPTPFSLNLKQCVRNSHVHAVLFCRIILTNISGSYIGRIVLFDPTLCSNVESDTR